MAEELVEALTREFARVTDEVVTKRKKRDELDAEIRRAERLMEAYELVLRSRNDTLPSPEQAALGTGDLRILGSDGALVMDDTPQPTISEAITVVLIERNRAMHADEILRELQARGMKLSAADPKASVVTALVRGARKGIFEKVGPNRYQIRRPITELDFGRKIEPMGGSSATE